MVFEAKGFTFPIYIANRRGFLSLPDITCEPEFDLALIQIENALNTFAQVASAPRITVILEEKGDG